MTPDDNPFHTVSNPAAKGRPGKRILKDKLYARDIAEWLGITRQVFQS